jgi:hypothetical protein
MRKLRLVGSFTLTSTLVAISVLVTSSCSKSEMQKMEEVQKCRVIEGSKGIEKCLVGRYDWEVAEAQAAGSDYRIREAEAMDKIDSAGRAGQ